MGQPRKEPVVIGWNELVDLPAWGVRRLRAKIDTGARTSALHVENIQELPRDRVQFEVVLHREKRDRHVKVQTKIVRRGRVRSSSGHQSMRIFVETKLVLGPVEKTIEVSLVDREKMLHRMLLGREALQGPFLIDVDRRLIHKPKRKVKKKASKKVKSKAKKVKTKTPTLKRVSRVNS